MKKLNFKLIKIRSGKSKFYKETGLETVLVLISGICTIDLGDRLVQMKRENVFTDKASAVFVPPGARIAIKAMGDTVIAACRAKAREKNPIVVISPEQIKEEWRGKEGYRRRVFNIVNIETKTERIAVGETINEPGQWSSFPPHKHDERVVQNDKVVEVPLEEIYFFKVSPVSSFAFQRLYNKKKKYDKALAIKDEQVVEIPNGYHPVAAAPGQQLYYLWMLAGDERTYIWNTDPDYQYLL